MQASRAEPQGVPSGHEFQASRWQGAVDAVKAASVRHGIALSHAQLIRLEPSWVVITFPKEAGFHKALLQAASSKPLVDTALSGFFGQPTQLRIEADAGGVLLGQSLAAQAADSRMRHERQTEDDARNHPSVRMTLRLLGGQLEHIRMLEPEAAPRSESEDGE